MFPAMSPDGARAAVAHFVMDSLAAKMATWPQPTTDAPYAWDVKPKYHRPTAQAALDAVCARARAKATAVAA